MSKKIIKKKFNKAKLALLYKDKFSKDFLKIEDKRMKIAILGKN